MEWEVGQLYPVIPEKLFITTHVCRAQTQREIQKHVSLRLCMPASNSS